VSELSGAATRLCLNELGSAPPRRGENRSDRLPEPVDLDQGRVSPASSVRTGISARARIGRWVATPGR
jgi:hypothetical protein